MKEKLDKQKLWRKRSFVLCRLSGMYIRPDSDCLTEEEINKINQINELRKSITDNFTENSRKLGFKARKRCKICKKPVQDESKNLCNKCS